MKSKVRRVKAWAVVWVNPTAANYGEKHGTLIRSVEENTDACAVFKTKDEAIHWHKGNRDWSIVPCTITYTLPKHH